MRIGLFGTTAGGVGGLDTFVEAARQAQTEGFASYWLSHVLGADALTALAVVGREVPDIELGSAVVPIFVHHPFVMAQQALTANLACAGRLTLGLGLSHKPVVEGMWGQAFTRPLTRMREYLTVLNSLLNGGAAEFEGETVTTRARLTLADTTTPPVLIAALGPKMLSLAGTLADGTITWMTGAETLARHTVPGISAAADAAGRARPRVVAAFPVCVTDDPGHARERAARRYAVYGQLPSYQAMLEREGAAGPADVAIVGDEDAVRAGVRRLEDSGVTDVAFDEFGDEHERRRTRELLRSLL